VRTIKTDEMANTTNQKFGGRKKGVGNKNNQALKELVKGFLTDNHTDFLNHLKSLDSKGYVNAYISMLRYALPTLKQMDVKQENDGMPTNFQIEILKSNKN
jgi:hypothetical protein